MYNNTSTQEALKLLEADLRHAVRSNQVEIADLCAHQILRLSPNHEAAKAYQVIREYGTKEKQFKAAELLKDWSIWLVTVQSGAITLITMFSKESLIAKNVFSLGTVICFALSIAVATWVLGSLPSIVQRVGPGDYLHDKWLFSWWPTPLWAASFAQHILFLLGLFCLIMHLLTMSNPSH